MAALKTARAWYAARSPLAKVAIVVGAVVLVSAPFVGEDPEAASAEDAPEPTATVTATATATATTTVTETAEPKEKARAESTEADDADAAPAATPEAAPSTPKAAPPRRTHTVGRVVDGDTVELANGETVRVVGIDTPERGECGYGEATANMERLVLGKRVRLTTSDEDRDAYGRLLRYVDVGGTDAGLRQIKAGLAIARYDSRDGYGYHPREDRYIAADDQTPDITCNEPKPKPTPTKSSGGGSAPVYFENCTAARDAGAAPVRRGDPGYGRHLDRDGDGVGCE